MPEPFFASTYLFKFAHRKSYVMRQRAAVLFDAYGTVIDVGTYHRDITEYVLDEVNSLYDRRIDQGEFNNNWNKEFERAFSDVNAYCGDFRNVRELYGISTKRVLSGYGITLTDNRIKELNAVYKKMLDEAVVVAPNVEKTLRVLHSEGYDMGLVSNGDTQELLEHMNGVKDYFDVIVTSEDLNVYKPDPRIFAEAIRRIGTCKEQTVFIGDTLTSDVLGAKKVGITSVWYNKKRRLPKYGIKPDFEIHDMPEVLQLLNSQIFNF
jgi:2-haloalkanoic acid dehalogenase type II